MPICLLVIADLDIQIGVHSLVGKKGRHPCGTVRRAVVGKLCQWEKLGPVALVTRYIGAEVCVTTVNTPS